MKVVLIFFIVCLFASVILPWLFILDYFEQTEKEKNNEI